MKNFLLFMIGILLICSSCSNSIEKPVENKEESIDSIEFVDPVDKDVVQLYSLHQEGVIDMYTLNFNHESIKDLDYSAKYDKYYMICNGVSNENQMVFMSKLTYDTLCDYIIYMDGKEYGSNTYEYIKQKFEFKILQFNNDLCYLVYSDHD